LAIFTTKLHTKHSLQTYEKLSYAALTANFLQMLLPCGGLAAEKLS
jgi:hypothetical protein